jgi:hypothetical protein
MRGNEAPEVEAVAVTTEDGKKHYQCHSPGRYGDEKASATQRITTPDAADAAIEKPQIRAKQGGDTDSTLFHSDITFDAALHASGDL